MSDAAKLFGECAKCHRETAPAELTAYRGCCEDCWSDSRYLPSGVAHMSQGQRYKNEKGQWRGMLVLRSSTRNLG